MRQDGDLARAVQKPAHVLSGLPRRMPVTIMPAEIDVRSVSPGCGRPVAYAFQVYRMHIWCLILRLVIVLPLAPDGVPYPVIPPGRCLCHGSGERYHEDYMNRFYELLHEASPSATLGWSLAQYPLG